MQKSLNRLTTHAIISAASNLIIRLLPIRYPIDPGRYAMSAGSRALVLRGLQSPASDIVSRPAGLIPFQAFGILPVLTVERKQQVVVPQPGLPYNPLRQSVMADGQVVSGQLIGLNCLAGSGVGNVPAGSDSNPDQLSHTGKSGLQSPCFGLCLHPEKNRTNRLKQLIIVLSFSFIWATYTILTSTKTALTP